MKKVTITNQLEMEEYEEVRLLYLQYYDEVLNLEAYTEEALQDKVDSATSRATDRKEENCSFWVAKDEETEEILGFAKAKTYPDGFGVFNHIFVKPEYRSMMVESGEKNNSIFRFLNSSVMEWFTEEGIHTVEIDAPKRATKLVAIGEKMNFEVVREFPNSTLLRKTLQPHRSTEDLH